MKTMTPDQRKAVSRLMANRRRQLNHISRSFPKYHEGMSTFEYVCQYMNANIHNGVNLLPLQVQP